MRIVGTQEGDFTAYKCTAENVLGVDEDSVQLTGIPGEVSISGSDCAIDTECKISFGVTSMNAVTEYHVHVREYNETVGIYGNLTLISVSPTQNETEDDNFAETFMITGLDPSTQYEVEVFAFTKYGSGPASSPHRFITNYEGATYAPPPTTTTPEPPTTIPPTTFPPTTFPPTTIPTTTEVVTTAPKVAEVDGKTTDAGFSIHDFHSLLITLLCFFTLIVT